MTASSSQALIMREGEICGLSWECVKLETGTIVVKQQLAAKKKSGGEYVLATPENGKARTITPAPFVMEFLREVKHAQAENRLKAGSAWQNERNLVFTNEVGHFIVPHTALKRLKAAGAKAGRPDARFHELRHTYAVIALQEGDDVKTVQENLGHATASFTLDVYGHVSEKMRKDSADRMQAYYASLNA